MAVPKRDLVPIIVDGKRNWLTQVRAAASTAKAAMRTATRT